MVRITPASRDKRLGFLFLSSSGIGGTFHVEVDQTNLTGAISIPNTGGFLNFQTVSRGNLRLGAGPHTLRVVFDTSGVSGFVGNLKSFALTSTTAPNLTQPASVWTNPHDGKWETAANWSAGRPGSALPGLVVNNPGNKTVLLDSNTVILAPASLTVSNLTIVAAPGATNIVSADSLGTANPVTIFRQLDLEPGGRLNIVNSGVSVLGLGVSNGLTIRGGAVSLNSGRLLLDQTAASIGETDGGLLALNGGTMAARSIDAGSGPFTVGAIKMTSGNQTVAESLNLGLHPEGSSGVFVSSGGTMLFHDCHVGVRANGLMSLMGGTVTIASLTTGNNAGGYGAIAVGGGTNVVTTALTIGAAGYGALDVTDGGWLAVSNAQHTASLSVVNGTVRVLGGTVIIDQLTLTNPTGHFDRTGGTLILNRPPLLDPLLDADGDGFNNAAELAAGSDPLNSTSIPTPPAKAGLVCWWPADGHARDIIGANHGLLVNGTRFAPGLVGQAFSFDGVDDYVAVLNSAAWDFGSGDFTIEFWVNLRRVKNSMFLHQQSGTGAGGFEFDFQRPNSTLIFAPDPGHVGIARGWSPGTNTWYHLAVSRGAGVYQLYVNGEALGGQQADPNPVAHVNGPLRIGNYTEPEMELNGLIDELSIYRRALSAQEIHRIYAAGSSGKYLPSLRITDITPSATDVMITWEAEPFFTNRLQYKTNLADGAWLAVPGDVVPTNTAASASDRTAAGAKQRFYRVFQLP